MRGQSSGEREGVGGNWNPRDPPHSKGRMYIYSVSQVLGMSESHPDSVLSLLCKERGNIIWRLQTWTAVIYKYTCM